MFFAEVVETFRRLAAGEEALSLLFGFCEDPSCDTELTRRDPEGPNMGDADLNGSLVLELDGADGYGTGGSESGETG